MKPELPRIRSKGPLRRAGSTFAISLVLLAVQPGSGTEIPELDRALETYRARVEEAALVPHRSAVEALDARYLAALDRALAEAQSGGDLEGALALRAERDAIAEGKAPNAAAEDLPPALERLRRTYEEEMGRLVAERARAIQPLLQECLLTLDSLIADLTREGRLDEALAARAKRAELEKESTEQLEAASSLAAETYPQSPAAMPPESAAQAQIPRDAVRHNRSHYKAYLVDEPVTWEQARERCRELGGDLAWFDSLQDERFIVGIMREVVAEKGHVPVWVGARMDEDGAWHWVNDDAIDAGFWQNPSDSQGTPGQSVMVRWIGSFRASSPDAARVAGYLCRWD